MPTLSAFLASAKRPATTQETFVSSNTTWGVALASELRKAVREAAARAPRSLQVHLGPSEIGEPCHRQVAGKLAGLPYTNHVADPWPSVVGTAVHAWLADALEAAQPGRWFTERRVVPIDGHSGTADLFDAQLPGVVDHKVLGPFTYGKLRRSGPGRKYYVQLLLYGLGYRRFGLPVQRVAIAAWPRAGSLSGLYIWGHDLTPEDDALVEYIIDTELPYRKHLAELIRSCGVQLMDVPVGDQEPDCYFCPFYRPEAKHNPELAGCPGPAGYQAPQGFNY